MGQILQWRGPMKMPVGKEAVDIEKLLRWAYTRELPKEQISTFMRPQGFTSPWRAITKSGELGVPIQEPDIRNRYGLVPDFTAADDPHPDAVSVFHAVKALDTFDLDMSVDWNPIPDLADVGPLAGAAVSKAFRRLCFRDLAGTLHFREPVPQLVTSHMIKGSLPDWRIEKPEVKVMCHANGKPRWFIREVQDIRGENMEIETDGFDEKSRRPKMGAFQKFSLDPDPDDAIAERIKYRVLHSAFGFLAEYMRGRLVQYEPVAPAIPAEPWTGEQRPRPRILHDLTPQPVVDMPRAIRRKRVDPLTATAH